MAQQVLPRSLSSLSLHCKRLLQLKPSLFCSCHGYCPHPNVTNVFVLWIIWTKYFFCIFFCFHWGFCFCSSSFGLWLLSIQFFSFFCWRPSVFRTLSFNGQVFHVTWHWCKDQPVSLRMGRERFTKGYILANIYLVNIIQSDIINIILYKKERDCSKHDLWI